MCVCVSAGINFSVARTFNRGLELLDRGCSCQVMIVLKKTDVERPLDSQDLPFEGVCGGTMPVIGVGTGSTVQEATTYSNSLGPGDAWWRRTKRQSTATLRQLQNREDFDLIRSGDKSVLT